MSAATPAAVRYVSAVAAQVIDGDTISANVDLDTKLTLGVSLWAHDVEVRLARSNAREIGQPGGPEARDHLVARLPAGTRLMLRVTGRDEYRNRVDAEVYLPDGTDLIDELLTDGWLAPWNGRGQKPVPPWPRPAGAA